VAVLRERVSDDIYVFTSDLYAQVTAGAIVTRDGVVLVDTLPFPSEAREMKLFVERVSLPGVRYIILTHYHADHTYGAYLFPRADVVTHALCKTLLLDVGVPALEAAQAAEPELEEVSLRLPDITFEDGQLSLRLGDKVMNLIHVPGHTADSVMVYVEDDRVLFAADTVLPVPSIVDGDIDELRASLRKVTELAVENMVQGHGEIILRGEVNDIVNISLAYLDAMEQKVVEVINRSKGRDKDRERLMRNSIESCGLSRIPLNGLVQQIHVANLLYLYDVKTADRSSSGRHQGI